MTGKLIIGNPYDYNYHSLKKQRENKVKVTPTANALLMEPEYNFIGKFLGIDTKQEWNQFYDKVYEIVEWAKEETDSEDVTVLAKAIKKVIDSSPTMSDKKINDVYISIKLKAKEETDSEDKKEVEK